MMLAVHLREPLPAVVEDEYVHGTEGGEPFRPTGHVLVPQVCAEETQLRKCGAPLQLS